MIEMITIPELKEAIAGQALARLPDWFPPPGEQYIAALRDAPFWADTEEEILRGFLALRKTSPFAWELFALGILPEFRRQGIGTRLATVAESYAKAKGASFFHARVPAASAEASNGFCRAVGFRPLMVIPEVWGAENPCQIYIKQL